MTVIPIENALGIDVLATFKSTEALPRPLGTRVKCNSNAEWLLVSCAAGVASGGQIVTIDENFSAALIATAAADRGDIVGVAYAAIPAGSRGWVQVRGPCIAQVAASCAANVRLNTTATAGQIDDDGTAASKTVDGLVLTTARGGTAGTAAAYLNDPAVGATL